MLPHMIGTQTGISPQDRWPQEPPAAVQDAAETLTDDQSWRLHKIGIGTGVGVDEPVVVAWDYAKQGPVVRFPDGRHRTICPTGRVLVTNFENLP